MITLNELRPGMIFQYASPYTFTMTTFRTTKVIVSSIRKDQGPVLQNYETGYSYGLVTDYPFFHKWNTTKETMAIAVKGFPKRNTP